MHGRREAVDLRNQGGSWHVLVAMKMEATLPPCSVTYGEGCLSTHL